MEKKFFIKPRDSVFEPGSRADKVKVRLGDGSRPRYKVFLFIEGRDLSYVDEVTYVLHRTFKQRRRTIKRKFSNPNCQLTIWTWGLFTIDVIVKDKSGQEHSYKHEMSYDQALNDLPDDRYEYVDRRAD